MQIIKKPGHLQILCGIIWGGLIFLGAAYVFSADLAINFNRIIGMMVYGDHTGVGMYYYLAGQWGAAPLAVAVGAGQVLLPAISKSVVAGANSDYFGAGWGLLLSLTGFFSGTVFAYGLGWSVHRFAARVRHRQAGVKTMGFIGQLWLAAALAAAGFLPLTPLQLVFYVAGMAEIPGKIYLPAAFVGGSAAYCLLFARI